MCRYSEKVTALAHADIFLINHFMEKIDEVHLGEQKVVDISGVELPCKTIIQAQEMDYAQAYCCCAICKLQ